MEKKIYNEMSTWYLLPGMGANPAMYNSLRREVGFEINYIDWPDYRGERTYAEVAKRVIDACGIKDGDIAGGSSLGGMIALEIARQRKLSAVVLLGSAPSPGEVQGLLSLLSPLAGFTPLSLIQILAGKHENIVPRMFAEADPEFVKSMCVYLRSWPGNRNPGAPLYRIHGKKDHVIPCPTEGCEIVPEAGHLLAITPSRVCGAFLNSVKMRDHRA